MDIICKTTKRRSESQQEVFTNMRQSSDNNLPLWLQITGKIGWEALAITIIQNENQLRHYNEGLTLCAFTINYLEGNRENKLSYTMLEMGMDCIKSLSKLLLDNNIELEPFLENSLKIYLMEVLMLAKRT